MGSGDLKNVSLLKAGYHIGINTVGQSLRNANLQLRSEPANPQLNVGPWNQTTITLICSAILKLVVEVNKFFI